MLKLRSEGCVRVPQGKREEKYVLEEELAWAMAGSVASNQDKEQRMVTGMPRKVGKGQTAETSLS